MEAGNLLWTDGKSNGGCYVLLCESRNLSSGCGQSPLKAVRKGQSHSDFYPAEYIYLPQASSWVKISPSGVTFSLVDLTETFLSFLKFPNYYQ